MLIVWDSLVMFVDTMFLRGHMNIYLWSPQFLLPVFDVFDVFVEDVGEGDYKVSSRRNWFTFYSCLSFFLLLATM